MIEELKVLLDAISDIPTLAVWVAFGYLLFRLATWGSVVAAIVICWKVGMSVLEKYNQMRLDSVIAKYNDEADLREKQLEMEQSKLDNAKEPKEVTLAGTRVSDSVLADLHGQVARLGSITEQAKEKHAGKKRQHYRMIHLDDVDWLRDAIDEKIARESEPEVIDE